MSCRNKETEKSLARCSTLSSRIDCVMDESIQERVQQPAKLAYHASHMKLFPKL